MPRKQVEIPPKDVWTPADVYTNVSFPFGIRHAAPQTPHTLHTHQSFFELSIVQKGQGIHFTEDEDYLVRAGDVFVIKGDQPHGYRETDQLVLHNICFDPKRILLPTNHVKQLPGYHVLFVLEPKYRRAHQFESRLHLNPEELAHLLSLVSVMDSELEEELPGYEYTVIALFMQAVSFVCRCYAQATKPTSRSLLRMANVISYLESHYAETVELSDLQELAHLSSSALLKNFKEATGLSPIEYLLRVRISRAIELLRHDEELTITDAAFSVGFSDSNYFARQFKRILHMTPSEYRSRMRPLASRDHGEHGLDP